MKTVNDEELWNFLLFFSIGMIFRNRESQECMRHEALAGEPPPPGSPAGIGSEWRAT